MTAASRRPDVAPAGARAQPDLQDMTSADLLAVLPPALRRGTLDYIDWLLRSTPKREDPESLVMEICDRLVALGFPLDRYRSSSAVTTADSDAMGRTWVRGQGSTITSYVREGDVEHIGQGE